MLTTTASFNLEEASSWPKPYVRPFSPHPSPHLATTKALRQDSWGRAALPTADAVLGPEGESRRQALSPHPPCAAPGRPSEAVLLRGPGQGVSRVPLPRPPGCGSGLETLPSTLTQYSVLAQPLPHLAVPGCPGSVNGRKLLGEPGVSTTMKGSFLLAGTSDSLNSILQGKPTAGGTRPQTLAYIGSKA